VRPTRTTGTSKRGEAPSVLRYPDALQNPLRQPFNSGDTLPFSCFLRPHHPPPGQRPLGAICFHFAYTPAGRSCRRRRQRLPSAAACLRLSSKTHAGRNSAEPSVRRGREWSDRFRHKSSTVVLDYSFGPRPSGRSADQTLSFVWLGESRTDIRSSPPTPHNELPISRVTT
jgi:hypothetical protein